ncbi:hypothetical protein E2C01_094433 [Portunus trituberculatus]|uniref:Uncharacterized protein n=1 Tax=Portunus trituberculatus TaxID=210409 RepID=A0A5B7JW50_PORTR|nr:hypothetical protein [Portunus trituberculatus]
MSEAPLGTIEGGKMKASAISPPHHPRLPRPYLSLLLGT